MMVLSASSAAFPALRGGSSCDMFEAHSSQPGFSFTCGVEGCSPTFETYSAVQSHLSRKHRGVDLEAAQKTPLEQDNQLSDAYQDQCTSASGFTFQPAENASTALTCAAHAEVSLFRDQWPYFY